MWCMRCVISVITETFALEVVNDYLDLLQQGDSMRLSYNNYTNRLFFQTEVNARVGGGLQAEFNAKQAQQLYTAKINHSSAQPTPSRIRWMTLSKNSRCR